MGFCGRCHPATNRVQKQVTTSRLFFPAPACDSAPHKVLGWAPPILKINSGTSAPSRCLQCSARRETSSKSWNIQYYKGNRANVKGGKWLLEGKCYEGSQKEKLFWLAVFMEKVVFELSRGLNMCSIPDHRHNQKT